MNHMEPSCFAPSPLESAAPRNQIIHVLHVEDDPETAWLTQEWITADDDHGQFCIEWIQTLSAAMKRLREPGVDVILLDLGLPELVGYRSFRAVDAAADSKIPIVILSSDERRVSREFTVGLGASDFLVKQKVSPVQLRQALRTARR
jgi:DNA-binding response OmpR family regulator